MIEGCPNWQTPLFDPLTRAILVQAVEGSSIHTKSEAVKIRRGTSRRYVASNATRQATVNIVKALDATSGAIN
jgi:hypothetical protein